MPAWSRVERAALADLLAEVGPDAPTLCEGWLTADLAAHLVARDRVPVAGIGEVVPLMSGLADRFREREKARPYAEVVERLRRGAPPWTWAGFPPTEPLANTLEFAIHHEDVRRAQPGWAPRVLPAAEQDVIWRQVQVTARVAFRRERGGVVLRRPDGQPAVVKGGHPVLTVSGEPMDLALYVAGRRGAARVEVTTGP